MSKIRVLQSITGFGVGGAERVVLSLANRLDPSSFVCDVVSFTPDCTSFEVFGPPTAPHTVIDVKSQPLSTASRVRDYARLLDRIQPNVVHVHMFHALLLTIAATTFSSVKPAIVFTSHNTEIAQGRRQFLWATRALRKADVIFFEGQHPQLNSRHTVVIPNGVDVGSACAIRSPPTPGRPIKLLFVGRLAQAKDPIGLVQAFASAQLPNACLDMVGTGPLEPQVHAMVRALNAQDRVNLLGLRSDTRELMRAADIFVLHSRHEGLPLVVLEAGAEAMPVVSTAIGGVPKLLKNDAGFLTNTENFSATLRQVSGSPEIAIKRGKNLFERVAKAYSTTAMVRAHEHLYRSVAAN